LLIFVELCKLKVVRFHNIRVHFTVIIIYKAVTLIWTRFICVFKMQLCISQKNIINLFRIEPRAIFKRAPTDVLLPRSGQRLLIYTSAVNECRRRNAICFANRFRAPSHLHFLVERPIIVLKNENPAEHLVKGYRGGNVYRTPARTKGGSGNWSDSNRTNL